MWIRKSDRDRETLGKNFIMPKFSDVISNQDTRDVIARIRNFSGT